MRVVIQRVTKASVSVDSQTKGAIGAGLVVLVGVTPGDSPAQAQALARKVAHLRIFEDDAGKMNRSLLDVGGGILVISQFTLYADCRRGRRPSFTDAARPNLAVPMIDEFVDALKALGVSPVATGEFGAYMLVEIHNDGPVTIILDSDVL